MQAKQFKNATRKVITYNMLIQEFNNLNEHIRRHGHGFLSYGARTDIKTHEGEVPGFFYTGVETGFSLRHILDALGIKYETHHISGEGVEEKSEIRIRNKESQKRFLDIMEKCGYLYRDTNAITLSSNIDLEVDPLKSASVYKQIEELDR